MAKVKPTKDNSAGKGRRPFARPPPPIRAAAIRDVAMRYAAAASPARSSRGPERRRAMRSKRSRLDTKEPVDYAVHGEERSKFEAVEPFREEL